jgi:single-stranded-DNA-specific exonuclease
MTSEIDLRPLPKRWDVHHKITQDVDKNLRHFPPLLRQLLYNRGIVDDISARHFIDGTVGFPTNPFLLLGMDAAVERTHQAVVNLENIVVYGDYDADGVTSTALMVEFFNALGVTPRVYIPNRYDEGYGLNEEAIHQLAEEGADLIITPQERFCPQHWR